MNILVGGSLRNVFGDPGLGEEFVRELGHEIVRQGQVRLDGCRSSLDEIIATAAAEWLTTADQGTAGRSATPRISSSPTAPETTHPLTILAVSAGLHCPTGT